MLEVDINSSFYRKPSPLPRRVTPEVLAQIDKVILDNQPRQPRAFEDYAGEGQPLPTIDVNGRMHAPCDGWTDYTGREYNGGQYVMEEGGSSFTSWRNIELAITDGRKVSRCISKSFSKDVYFLAYASEQAIRAISSKHLFAIKERKDFTGLKCLELTLHEGWEYGNSLTHTFIDGDGNIIQWKTSKQVCTPGDIISLKGTVKSHYTNRHGVEVTVITRAKVLTK